jgi:hypothetical protein
MLEGERNLCIGRVDKSSVQCPNLESVMDREGWGTITRTSRKSKSATWQQSGLTSAVWRVTSTADQHDPTKC